MTTWPPRVRRPLLATHVICSVGWIGAALAYLALGLAAQLSDQPGTVQAAWIGMELIGWPVLVPLGGLAWATGILLSMVTHWGLLRHYWVVIALVLTTVALVVMVLHLPAVTVAATVVRTGDPAAISRLGGDVLHPAGGLAVLVVVAVLNIYKPRGLTPRGQRRARRPVAVSP